MTQPSKRAIKTLALLGQQPICTSDYGVEVYACRFTGVPVHADNCRIVGSIIPQARVQYVASLESREAEKLGRLAFDQYEANCNTCKNLERVPSRKGLSGLLYGRCKATPDLNHHPYASRMVEGVMAFAPDDWMGMPCWEPR